MLSTIKTDFRKKLNINYYNYSLKHRLIGLYSENIPDKFRMLSDLPCIMCY